ncbi:MAG TPA: hypothetical protein VKD47_07185, partial [Miltoncostaeaceae bacterium]|nr:hypothetical protein [Miltoncostaeaceae bacterium]
MGSGRRIGAVATVAVAALAAVPAANAAEAWGPVRWLPVNPVWGAATDPGIGSAAMNDRGDVVVGFAGSAMVRERDGRTLAWAPPRRLGAPSRGLEVRVAIDERGDAAAAWTRGARLLGAVRRGGRWSAPSVVADGVVGNSDR